MKRPVTHGSAVGRAAEDTGSHFAPLTGDMLGDYVSGVSLPFKLLDADGGGTGYITISVRYGTLQVSIGAEHVGRHIAFLTGIDQHDALVQLVTEAVMVAQVQRMV